MLDTESSYGEETLEAPPPMSAEVARGGAPNLAVRRRIERMRELKRLRELLDDPDFDDLS
ncbi:MAG: PA3496 family putative envelope integrity protein [Bdellovibrio bacteriovorus]